MSRTQRLYNLIALFLLFNSVKGKEWLKEEFPNPLKDRESCGRFGVKSWICDPDNILSNENANTLEEMLQHVSKTTNSGCSVDPSTPGYQIGIAVMNKMAVSFPDSKENVAKEFAKYLHNNWGVGRKDCDDGVLMMISVQDRQVYITTGRKAKDKLTNDQIDIIIGKMRPGLRDEKYGKSFQLAVELMHKVFSGEKLDTENLTGLVVILMLVFSFISFALYSNYKNKQYEKCKEKLNRIERERDAAKNSKSFVSSSCPICLENFTPEMCTRLLLCGHKYCEPCLTKWLETKSTCPICRQSTDNKSSTQKQCYDFFPELDFRLTNLQRQYPGYISNDMLHYWMSQQYSGSFAEDTRFTQARPFISSGTGSFGTNTDFGGGSCDGGGGSGGSW